MESEIAAFDESTQKQVEADPALSRQVAVIKNIKGIKSVVAVTLTAELGNLADYGRPQLVAVAGVFPKKFSSGKSVHRPPRLAKGGGGCVRRVLYMAAVSLFRSKGVLRDVIDRYRQRGLSDMCITGIMMRKLLLVARAAVVHGTYDESKVCFQV